MEERVQLTFDGKTIPINRKNPDRELSHNERKLYNILKLGPRTHAELIKYLYVHPIEGLSNITHLHRMLRRVRTKGFLRTIPQRHGPQKWEATP